MIVTWRDENRRPHEADTGGPKNGVDIALIGTNQSMMFVQDLRLDGELAVDRMVVQPGGFWTAFRGEFERIDEAPVPEWAPLKLEQSPVALVGPYMISWPSDHQGNAVGGEGIAPYWGGWRKCAAGYRYAMAGLLGSMNRTPVNYHDGVEVDKFALQAGFDRPIGYTYDIEHALRWDRDAQDYLSYWIHDGQHLARITRWIYFLWGMHPVVRFFAEKLLVHIKLSYDRRDIAPTTNTRLWTMQQWLEEPDIDVRRSTCGRELAHVYRFVKFMEPAGQLCADIEDLILSCGMPWFLDSRSIYAPESRIDMGGPWGSEIPLAHTFELLLMQDAIKGSPRLEGAARQMHEFLGDTPGWTTDGTGEQWTPPTGFGPDGYALFRGDFESANYEDAIQLLQVSGGRGVEDNPLDCCPRRFWQEFVP